MRYLLRKKYKIMKYIKEFANHSAYEAFTATTAFVKPNVSLCDQENEVHFNPVPPPPPTTAITYSATSKLNIDLTNFTPAATAETFADGVGVIEFAEPVTAIGGGCFYATVAANSIAVPGSVTSIGAYAFKQNFGLESFTCFATTPPSLDTMVFEDNINIYVPSESVDAYKNARLWKAHADRIFAIP